MSPMNPMPDDDQVIHSIRRIATRLFERFDTLEDAIHGQRCQEHPDTVREDIQELARELADLHDADVYVPPDIGLTPEQVREVEEIARTFAVSAVGPVLQSASDRMDHFISEMEAMNRRLSEFDPDPGSLTDDYPVSTTFTSVKLPVIMTAMRFEIRRLSELREKLGDEFDDSEYDLATDVLFTVSERIHDMSGNLRPEGL